MGVGVRFLVGSGQWAVGSGKWEVGSGKWEVGSGHANQVCLRPVGPVPPAWHEMPGQNAPRILRPVRAALRSALRVPWERGLRGGWGCGRRCVCGWRVILRLRPVGPAPSAWHEMRGQNAPRNLRPVRAALRSALRVPWEHGLRGGWGCGRRCMCGWRVILRLRPVGPAPSAWHEMPGQNAPAEPSPCKGSSQQGAACAA